MNNIYSIIFDYETILKSMIILNRDYPYWREQNQNKKVSKIFTDLPSKRSLIVCLL